VFVAKTGFTMQVEFGDLFRFEQTDHQINTLGFPAGNLVVEPIARARPRHNCKPTRERYLDPMDIGAHLRAIAASSALISATLKHSALC